MNVIKNFFHKLLQVIDDGRFLIKPMKWFYYIKGVVPFVLPFLFLYIIIKEVPFKELDSTWSKFLYCVFTLLFILYITILSYINYLFWFHRARRLEQEVRRGSNIVVTPLLADNIKNNGEIVGIMLSAIVIGGVIVFYLFLLLSGEKEVYEDWNFLKMLIPIILISCICIVVSFFIIMFTHFVTEWLRLFAQMCNDLRDVADIHRAATIQKKTEVMEQDTQLDVSIKQQS